MNIYKSDDSEICMVLLHQKLRVRGLYISNVHFEYYLSPVRLTS